MKTASKALKGRNLAWLVATLILDFIILLVLVLQTTIEELTPDRITDIRATLAALLPIPALILSSLLPPHHKAVMVFWRLKNPLPGSRSFSVHAPADHRVDLENLKNNVGHFPSDERTQNSKWYSLYKQVDSEPAVIDSHKNYLLFRDIAAMSLLLIPIIPAVMFFIGADTSGILISAAWFVGQYLITAIAARTAGIRLVQNVLAIHSGKVSSEFSSRQIG
jgi:hypothetical protein